MCKNNKSKLFKHKQKITGQTGDNSRKKFKIMVPLNCLIDFWRTLEMPLIRCEINFILTWSEKSVIASNTSTNKATIFSITDTKL